jgi:hypothetical protein
MSVWLSTSMCPIKPCTRLDFHLTNECFLLHIFPIFYGSYKCMDAYYTHVDQITRMMWNNFVKKRDTGMQFSSNHARPIKFCSTKAFGCGKSLCPGDPRFCATIQVKFVVDGEKKDNKIRPQTYDQWEMMAVRRQPPFVATACPSTNRETSRGLPACSTRW